MSEERRNSELNEAELNNVSGGGRYPLDAAINDADHICEYCPLGVSKPCDNNLTLRTYIIKIYPKRIHNYTECPSYK